KFSLISTPLLFLLRLPSPPKSTLFPYTTLFRSREGRVYNGQALTVGSGKDQRTTMLVSMPVFSNDHFLGMIGVVVEHGHTDKHRDRKSTRLNSSHVSISYAVFCLKKKKKQ